MKGLEILSCIAQVKAGFSSCCCVMCLTEHPGIQASWSQKGRRYSEPISVVSWEDRALASGHQPQELKTRTLLHPYCPLWYASYVRKDAASCCTHAPSKKKGPYLCFLGNMMLLVFIRRAA